MCINWYTSLGALGLGSWFNYKVLSTTTNPNYRMIAWLYQYILLMQVFDFMAWTDPKCGWRNRLATQAAYLQNILQPVVMVLILLVGTQVRDIAAKGWSGLALLVYLAIVLYYLYYTNGSSSPQTCMRPTSACKHLDYTWWYLMPVPILIYLIPYVVAFPSLIRPTSMGWIQFIYVLVSYLAGHFFYACGSPSLFCLFAAGGPVLNYFLLSHSKL